MGEANLKKTCKTCTHAVPVSTNAIGTWVAECRESCPCVILVPQGPHSAAISSRYPPVDDKFPACSKYHLDLGNGAVVITSQGKNLKKIVDFLNPKK